jgi:outer membrane receptor protein involved in Fe transport
MQWMSDFRGSLVPPEVITLDGFTKFDLLLSYKFSKGPIAYQIDLFIDNLLDEDFYYAGPVAAYPRNYKITVKCSF